MCILISVGSSLKDILKGSRWNGGLIKMAQSLGTQIAVAENLSLIPTTTSGG